MQKSYKLSAGADFHVHLRDGAVSRAVVPTIRRGGVNTVYVMPNLTPPITSVEAAVAYRERLRAIDPSITYLMTLYLHQDVTPETIRAAKAAGIVGVKSYPAGVTTNSAAGVVDYERFYPVFDAMQEAGLVLNLHGEMPPAVRKHARENKFSGSQVDKAENKQQQEEEEEEEEEEEITVLNAEAAFLPTLRELHTRFPLLKIVLEHCTTAAAVAAVQECGDNVVATITTHHLSLLVDDWAGNPLNYCKPVAKTPADRRALLKALVGDGIGNTKRNPGKFFLGTDSAPHPVSAKLPTINFTSSGPAGKSAQNGGTEVSAAAGVFTQPYALAYLMTALEDGVARGDISDDALITQELLEGITSGYGRKFYGLGPDKSGEQIVLRGGEDEKVVVDACVELVPENVRIVPFQAGRKVWRCDWL